jgi:hypothetical protein
MSQLTKMTTTTTTRLRGRIGCSVIGVGTMMNQQGDTVLEVPNTEEMTAGITMTDQRQSTKLVAITSIFLGGEVSTSADCQEPYLTQLAGASPPRFPRAVYRNGRLEDYDLAAGGSGLWSIDEEDSPAVTFGGRANRWDEESQHRRDHSHEGTDRFAGSPETDPEPFISACRGGRRSRNQSQDVPNAGSSRGAQPRPQLYESPRTAYDMATEAHWRRVESAYWTLVLYGYVDRPLYPYLYRDFHPPAEEIVYITRQYWTLIMQRGIYRFRVPVWRGFRFEYRTPFEVARPEFEETGLVGIPPRSPRSPW